MVSFDLPIDLITEILLRLPAKTVLRFKSACKTWYAPTENHNFIDKHQINSPIITSILVTTAPRMYFKDEGFHKPIDFSPTHTYVG